MDWVVEGGKGSHEMTKARSPNQISRNHAKPTMGTRGTTGRGAGATRRHQPLAHAKMKFQALFAHLPATVNGSRPLNGGA